jgi:hypothetical protein
MSKRMGEHAKLIVENTKVHIQAYSAQIAFHLGFTNELIVK